MSFFAVNKAKAKKALQQGPLTARHPDNQFIVSLFACLVAVLNIVFFPFSFKVDKFVEMQAAAQERGTKMFFTYQKAITSLSKFPVPIRNAQDALRLDGSMI
jgi:hypothetical protein